MKNPVWLFENGKEIDWPKGTTFLSDGSIVLPDYAWIIGPDENPVDVFIDENAYLAVGKNGGLHNVNIWWTSE